MDDVSVEVDARRASRLSDGEVYTILQLLVKHILSKHLSRKLLWNIYQVPIGREAVKHTVVTSKLQVTDMSSEHLIATIRGLKAFPNLKELSVEDAFTGRRNQELNDLLELTQLRSLKLVNVLICSRRFLNLLDALVDLEELSLTSYLRIDDSTIVALSRLTRLRSLILVDLRRVSTLDGLAECTRLEYLSLNERNFGMTLALDSIRRLPLLKSLRLCSDLVSHHVETLSAMQQLKALVLEASVVDESEHLLSRLTQLTQLRYFKDLLELPPWISCLTCLRHLRLSFRHGSEGQPLNLLPTALEELELYRLKDPFVDRGFSNLIRLKKLVLKDVEHGSKGMRQDALVQLKNVEDLALEDFKDGAVSMLPSFAHMTDLIRLSIRSRRRLEVNSLAEQSHRLRYLCLATDVSDDDLEVISKMKTLETLLLDRATQWTFEGFCLLTRLRRLTDLQLNQCTKIELTPQRVEWFMTSFECLRHLGVIPLRFEGRWDEQYQSIDDEGRMKDEIPEYIIYPAIQKYGIRVFDDGYGTLTIDYFAYGVETVFC